MFFKASIFQVCQKSYGTLKDLSMHIAETNHFEGKVLAQDSPGGGSMQTTDHIPEKKKKALPVKKLLALERGGANLDLDEVSMTKCDKCGEKYFPHKVWEHFQAIFVCLLLSNIKHNFIQRGLNIRDFAAFDPKF